MTAIRQFENSQNSVDTKPSPLPRICIVTSELVGLFANGGLGTAMTGMAELLSTHRAPVSVLYTGKCDANSEQWVQKYRKAGIYLVLLESLRFSPLLGPLSTLPWAIAWNVFQYLRKEQFEVIHFNDTHGEGLYCFLAKKCGLEFQETLLVLALHSPTEWILESNRITPSSMEYSLNIAAEKTSIATCDVLWGPSRYLLNWLSARDYVLPDQVYLQQYVMPTKHLFSRKRPHQKNHTRTDNPDWRCSARELVFFGRLEERKGLRLFANALSLLNDTLKDRAISVTFLGKQTEMDGISSLKFLQSLAGKWTFDWKVIDSLGQQEAISYLKGSDRVAVMASPVDNSPCTVYESLINEIPFIAANTGGIPELLDPSCHETHLFEYNTNSLCGLLNAIFESGIKLPRASVPLLENQRRWLEFHSAWRGYLPSAENKPIRKNWAVIIQHDGPQTQVRRTLNSLQATDGIELQRIWIYSTEQAPMDSAVTEGCAAIGNSFEFSVEKFMDSLWSGGANYLLLLRSGAEVKGAMLEKYEILLQAKADALLPAAFIEKPQGVYIPAGGCAPWTFLEKEYDAGCVVFNLESSKSRSVLSRLSLKRPHLGILEELYAVGGTVWPFPETGLTLESYEDVRIKPGGEFERQKALLAAPSQVLHQILSITTLLYGEGVDPILNPSTRRFHGLKTWLYSSPRLTKRLFGNRVMRKIAYHLYALSRF